VLLGAPSTGSEKAIMPLNNFKKNPQLSLSPAPRFRFFFLRFSASSSSYVSASSSSSSRPHQSAASSFCYFFFILFTLEDFFFFFVEEVAAIVAVIRRLSWCIEEASAKSNATVHVEGASWPSTVEVSTVTLSFFHHCCQRWRRTRSESYCVFYGSPDP